MPKSILTKCRTCLKSEENFRLLEKKMGLKFIKVTYKEALISLTNITIQVDQEEHMPQRICKACSRKLRAAQQFIKQAQDANSELLSMLRSVQQSSLKQLDCLKEPSIDLDVNKYVQVKLEEELGDSQIIAATIADATTTGENVLAIKKENDLPLKSEDVHGSQEIINENSIYPLNSAPIDPLPVECSIEKCDDTSPNNATQITSGNSSSTQSQPKTHKKRKTIKTKPPLEGDDLLPVGCEDCGKIYENAEQLARHKRSTHLPDELKIPCPNCGRKFSRRYNMYTHMRTFHGKESVEDLLRPPDSLIARKKYECEKCPCKYTNIYKLHAHIRRMHDPTKDEVTSTRKRKNESHKVKKTYTFLCTYCGLPCCSQTALKIHTRRHTGEKPFKCDLCDKAYPRMYDVEMHRRTHTGEKPHICSVCAKAFRRPDKLTDHMRSHSNERPYKCTQCDRAFKRPKELTIHMRVHTAERPYNNNAAVCLNTFTQNIERMKAHQMKYENSNASNNDVTATKRIDDNDNTTTTSITAQNKF